MRVQNLWHGFAARFPKCRFELNPHVVLVGFVLMGGCASSPPHGKLTQTDRAFDFAIDGEGYFIVETGLGGYLFTRKGDFMVDSQRYLATTDGYRLAPSVQLPENTHDLSVTLDGQVMADIAGATQPQPAGRFVIATFATPAALQRDGNYFLPTVGSGDPVTQVPGSGGAGTIKSRVLEK